MNTSANKNDKKNRRTRNALPPISPKVAGAFEFGEELVYSKNDKHHIELRQGYPFLKVAGHAHALRRLEYFLSGQDASSGQSVLVTGERGAGKTTLVNQAIYNVSLLSRGELTYALSEAQTTAFPLPKDDVHLPFFERIDLFHKALNTGYSPKVIEPKDECRRLLLDVRITIARSIDAPELQKRIVRKFYFALVEYGIGILAPDILAAARWAYIRTLTKKETQRVSERLLHRINRQAEIGLNSKEGLAIRVGAFAQEELDLLREVTLELGGASFEDSEDDLQELLLKIRDTEFGLKEGVIGKIATFWREIPKSLRNGVIDANNKLWRIPPITVHPVFVFDELDKLNIVPNHNGEQLNENRERFVKSLEGLVYHLKQVLTTGSATFIFIGGEDVAKDWGKAFWSFHRPGQRSPSEKVKCTPRNQALTDGQEQPATGDGNNAVLFGPSISSQVVYLKCTNDDLTNKPENSHSPILRTIFSDHIGLDVLYFWEFEAIYKYCIDEYFMPGLFFNELAKYFKAKQCQTIGREGAGNDVAGQFVAKNAIQEFINKAIPGQSVKTEAAKGGGESPENDFSGDASNFLAEIGTDGWDKIGLYALYWWSRGNVKEFLVQVRQYAASFCAQQESFVCDASGTKHDTAEPPKSSSRNGFDDSSLATEFAWAACRGFVTKMFLEELKREFGGYIDRYNTPYYYRQFWEAVNDPGLVTAISNDPSGAIMDKYFVMEGHHTGKDEAMVLPASIWMRCQGKLSRAGRALRDIAERYAKPEEEAHGYFSQKGTP